VLVSHEHYGKRNAPVPVPVLRVTHAQTGLALPDEEEHARHRDGALVATDVGLRVGRGLAVRAETARVAVQIGRGRHPSVLHARVAERRIALQAPIALVYSVLIDKRVE